MEIIHEIKGIYNVTITNRIMVKTIKYKTSTKDETRFDGRNAS